LLAADLQFAAGPPDYLWRNSAANPAGAICDLPSFKNRENVVYLWIEFEPQCMEDVIDNGREKRHPDRAIE
jgi:hypothetical protein